MEFLDSLYTSIFGIAVVFAVLAIMILMIYLLATAVRLTSKPKNAVSSIQPFAPEPEPSAPPSGPQELKLIDVDEKTAAMIMAIVCDETGTPPNELYFKSIRLLQDNVPAQNEGV